MFKLAYVKLTALYVLIVMLISIIFSVAIYRISYNEINRGLGRQTRVFQGVAGGVGAGTIGIITGPAQDLEDARLLQLADSDGRIKSELLYLNIMILVLSTVISYLLARMTLKPIEDMVTAQNRFTADASHELRTPLTAMRTEIEVMLREKKISLVEAKALLNSNLEEVGKLESLASALLKLAKYQDKGRLDLEEIVMDDVVAEAYEKIESLAAKKSIEFDNKVDGIKAMGDKASMVELFVILFDNAIKYSKQNTKISIKAKNEIKHVEIAVADQGIGISASDLPYIFNRFYRADHSRTKVSADGYGLGLSIAKQISEANQGSIWATSKPGYGSQFHVKLLKA